MYSDIPFSVSSGPSPDGIREPDAWCEMLRGKVQELFVRSNLIMPVGFVLATVDPRSGEEQDLPMQINVLWEDVNFDVPQKKLMAHVLQIISTAGKALGVVFACEAIVAKAEPGELEALKVFSEKHDLKEWPGGYTKQVIFSYQKGGDASTLLYTADIAEQDGTRTLGAFVEQGTHEGRFAGFLPAAN